MDSMRAMTKLVRRLERQIKPRVPVVPDQFDYVALPEFEFLAGMDIVSQHTRPAARFLDVGCGIGTKMFLAEMLGYSVHGIDIHPEYVELTNTIIGSGSAELVDAFTYTDYDKFDVIYMYQPCKFRKNQLLLNEHIVSHARPGTILFIAGSRPEAGTELGSQVWRV